MARVLFVCRQNAGRSQISEAFFRQRAGDAHQARSAGTTPAETVHPVVVTAMGEVGVDLASARPQALTADLARWADVVVTMGCGDACPVIPGKRYLEWEVRDPAGQPIEVVRSIRAELSSRVDRLIEDLG